MPAQVADELFSCAEAVDAPNTSVPIPPAMTRMSRRIDMPVRRIFGTPFADDWLSLDVRERPNAAEMVVARVPPQPAPRTYHHTLACRTSGRPGAVQAIGVFPAGKRSAWHSDGRKHSGLWGGAAGKETLRCVGRRAAQVSGGSGGARSRALITLNWRICSRLAVCRWWIVVARRSRGRRRRGTPCRPARRPARSGRRRR